MRQDNTKYVEFIEIVRHIQESFPDYFTYEELQRKDVQDWLSFLGKQVRKTCPSFIKQIIIQEYDDALDKHDGDMAKAYSSVGIK